MNTHKPHVILSGNMKDFTFHNPTKLIFGKSAMDKIAENAVEYGKKILVTYGGGSIKKNGIYEKVMEQLDDFDVKEFGGIEPNPRVETIRKVIEGFRDFDPDLVLAVGGGSVIDASKLIISSMHYDGDPWDFMVKSGIAPRKHIPLATVLTLSATGSEMNKGSVITKWETNEKLPFSRNENYPKFSILDPQNTFTVPRDQTAYGIIDSYSHVLEQYLTNTKDAPLQERLAESIMLTLIENGQIALDKPNDYAARANLMFSATMALNRVISMGVDEDWATHRIEHEISAFYDIPHAAGLAIVTPRWMEVARHQKKDKFVQYGKRVWGLEGDDEEIVDCTIKETHDFFKSLDVKMSLKEWNIDDEHFDTMTSRLIKLKVGEIPLTGGQIKEILRNCLTDFV